MEFPFILRGNLTKPKFFFGRKDIVSQIFHFLNKGHPDSVSIVGQRRIGKTFVLQFISLSLETQKKYLGEDFEKFTFIYWDLTLRPPANPFDFKLHLLKLLFKHLPVGLKEWFDPNVANNDIEEILFDGIEMLEDSDHHVVLLFDEFASISNNINFDVTFFTQQRSLGQSPSFAFVTATAKPLSELCHSEEISSSPYFNIFSTINLSLLDTSEVEAMIKDVLSTRCVDLKKGAVSEYINLTGCHPCLMTTLLNIFILTIEQTQCPPSQIL